MSDEKDTLQMPAITGRDGEADETLTDEFQIDDDVRDNEATRRLDSGNLPSIKSSAHSFAAVPGKNATLPLPAVAASKTAATPVPEAVLASMRTNLKATEPDRPPISGESLVRAAELAGPDDETVDRAAPLLTDHESTAERHPTVSFLAEIDGDGKVFIPRQYMGMLRFGQKVAVQIQVIPQTDS